MSEIPDIRDPKSCRRESSLLLWRTRISIGQSLPFARSDANAILPMYCGLRRRCAWICLIVFLVAGNAWGGEIRRVPEDYPSVVSAYSAAQSGDVIEVNTNLLLETPPVLFAAGKQVSFRSGIRRAIVTANVPPSNDVFSGRTTLSGGNLSVTAFNYAAAVAPEPEDRLPRAAGTYTLAFGRSLWFEWTAPATGKVIVNSVGSDFDTLLEVFDGIAPPLTPVNSVWFGFNEVGFNALAGQAYAILVGGQNSAFGEVRLNITYTAPPPNDQFANAFPLVGNVAQFQGSTFGTSREPPSEPNHAGAGGSNSVWFTWTAPTNDARFPRPVTFSSAGSDFDTVLAIYEGTNLASLTLRTNNNDRAFDQRESEVTFTPVAGVTYHIALDGTSPTGNARDQVGNYLLKVDYSLISATVHDLVREPLVNQQVNFRGNLTVRDWGLAPTAPLRVRLTARPGRNFAGVHRAHASNEITLATYSLPNTLLPNVGTTIPIAGTCPAPLVDHSRTNIWGVFAVVEESFADFWIPVDRLFLIYGLVPETGRPILSYGVGKPIPPAAVKNEINEILSTDVWVYNHVTDLSSNVFAILARLEIDGERFLTNRATWTAGPGIDLTTNGVLRVGELQASTRLMITGRYVLGGAWETRVGSIPIYRRPTLQFLPGLTANTVAYEIHSDFEAAYSLEVMPSLGTPTSQTNQLGQFKHFPVTNLLPNLPPGFYRLNALPTR